MSSVKLLINPVRPIISQNLAGGLFSSVNPHTKRPEGTPTAAYHMYREPMNLLSAVFPLPPPAAVLAASPAFCCFCNTKAARSRLAARSAARSCLEISLRAKGRLLKDREDEDDDRLANLAAADTRGNDLLANMICYLAAKIFLTVNRL